MRVLRKHLPKQLARLYCVWPGSHVIRVCFWQKKPHVLRAPKGTFDCAIILWGKNSSLLGASTILSPGRHGEDEQEREEQRNKSHLEEEELGKSSSLYRWQGQTNIDSLGLKNIIASWESLDGEEEKSLWGACSRGARGGFPFAKAWEQLDRHDDMINNKTWCRLLLMWASIAYDIKH